jgi:hypothetical protein
VDEDVTAGFPFDEPVSLGVVEPLDLACNTHSFPALQLRGVDRRRRNYPPCVEIETRQVGVPGRTIVSAEASSVGVRRRKNPRVARTRGTKKAASCGPAAGTKRASNQAHHSCGRPRVSSLSYSGLAKNGPKTLSSAIGRPMEAQSWSARFITSNQSSGLPDTLKFRHSNRRQRRDRDGEPTAIALRSTHVSRA